LGTSLAASPILASAVLNSAVGRDRVFAFGR
jgi:hypothetical protein